MKDKICGIYCIKRIKTGQKYIGQGLNVKKRMSQSHKECDVLYNSIKKYGKENFDRRVIIYCENWELTRLEIACIKVFRSHTSGGGYNISWGGVSPMSGRNHSDESKKKMSKSHMGEKNGNYNKPKSEETKEKMRGPRPNFHQTDEVKQYLREIMSGENHPQYGTHRSNETKKRISDGHRRNRLEGKVRKIERKTERNPRKIRSNSNNLYVSIYSEISWDKSRNKWLACIYLSKGKNKKIGRYNNEIEAAMERDLYIIENDLSSPLNFPELWEDRRSCGTL